MKMLASDLDGTLVIENKINKRDKEYVNKLRDKGHKFIISTGRTVQGVNQIVRDHGVEYDYLVLCNGALIIDEKGNIVQNNTISTDIAMDILNDYYNEENVAFYYDDGERTILIEKADLDYREITFVDDYFTHRFTKEDILKEKTNYQIISLFATDKSIDRAEAIREKVSRKYGDKVEVFRNQYFVDIAPKGCSKAEGIKVVADNLNIPLENIYTVGDSYNDISMFKLNENSFTFNRAEKAVKEQAKNKIDFVYEVIENIIGE